MKSGAYYEFFCVFCGYNPYIRIDTPEMDKRVKTLMDEKIVEHKEKYPHHFTPYPQAFTKTVGE